MPHELSNKQSLCLNPDELNHIYGLPHQAQLLYIAIRRQMNYANGLVGDRYSVSWLELSQALWVEPHSGRKNTGRPEIGALRKTAQLLVKVGLISFQSDKKAKRLILKCELATTDAGNGNGNGKKSQEIETLKTQIKQLQAENQRLAAKLNDKPVSEPPSKKAQVPTETDHQIAEQLLAIKQSARPSTRTPDLKVWAKSVMTIRERVSIPNENDQGSHNNENDQNSHNISPDEIVLAFQYAHQINPFWTEQGIITSPATLLEHLTRKKKNTFRESFIDWLGTRGTKHETHISSHKTSPTKLSAQESARNAVRAAFAEINVELETDPQ